MRKVIVIIKKVIFFFFPPLKYYYSFQKSITYQVSFKQWCLFWIKRNKSIYWPVSKYSYITHPNNIFVGIMSNPGSQNGCYIQGNGGVFIGDYVLFANNIGVISGNHSIFERQKHECKEVRIGDNSWIGMNSIILPGVILGPCTIVGAGSVVTKSFPEGYCIIAGNPAKVIKNIDKEKVVPEERYKEYYGYIPKVNFKVFAQKNMRNNRYYSEIIEKLKKN